MKLFCATCSLLIIALTISSCSVRNLIPKDERIYRGASAKIIKEAGVKESKRTLRGMVLQAAVPKPNKFLLGHPYKVWWWYKIGEPRKEKGLKSFLRQKLGESPVFASRVNAEKTAENMGSLMSNLGYFRSSVTGDTTNYSYFTKAKYIATILPQYHIGKIEWVSDSTSLIQILKAEFEKNGFIKTGSPYTLSTFSAEYDRLDLFLKTKGYYYFNPNYLYAYVDSTVGNRKVDVLFNIKKTTPAIAKKVFSINEITLYPNYSLDDGSPDTGRISRISYDSLFIQDSTNKFRKRIFAQAVLYRPSDVYNSQEQNATLNRLINLGVFKFVKSRYQPDKDSLLNRLNVFYYLTPLPKRSLQAQVDAFTKENNYVGTEVSVGWQNRNAFRGAEKLGAKTYASIETTSGVAANSNIRFGAEATLKVPRYIVPFFKVKERKYYPPSTNFLAGYEYFIRTLLYTKSLIRLNTDFTFKDNIHNQFTISPFTMSYLSVSGITDSFKTQLAANPALQLNVYPEVTLGSFINYSYNSLEKSSKNKWYFAGGLDLAGNILGLVSGAKNFREKNFLGTPFAQYVKLDADLHYTRVLNKKKLQWANRFLIGVGMPYGNSRLLPYAKLYTIGGASSVRGFRSRALGPGTHLPTINDQKFFQVIGGDYKLLGNSELRIPLSKLLSAAVFLDAGNIWTKDTILFGQEGKLTNKFLNEIAVSSGFGVRFDATILLIRADLGIPLRKPYLPDGQRWVTGFDFGSKAWRRENLILNIAIGLPF